MLSLNNITKKYGNFTALEDIDLEFTGGVYGLLAPNGAGKTTLIKMLTMLIFPTKGEIFWNGNEIEKLDSAYRNIIGYLPQDFGYYKNHSPLQFLKYLAALKGIDAKTADRKSRQLLELVSLSDVRDKKMRKFSGGMIQRVGIAQAMLNDPKILILDEPTAGLDPKERVRFRNLISSLSKDRIVILSTHIVSDIETIANRVIMFKDHKLLTNHTPAAICQMLDDKVYETDDSSVIPAGSLMLTERQDGGKTITRFAFDGECPALAKKASPNLEDVFLYIFRDEAA
jgi:ABC-type multidrug transport system ATPase subunit